MDGLDLRKLKQEMADSTREARTAGKRVKVTKSHLNKTETNWEELIDLGNEIAEQFEAKTPRS